MSLLRGRAGRLRMASYWGGIAKFLVSSSTSRAMAAHAQGSMDFSGATTLMTTFKTFCMYAGAVICLVCLVWAGIKPFRNSSALCLALACWGGACAGSALLRGKAFHENPEARRAVTDQPGHEQGANQTRSRPAYMAFDFVCRDSGFPRGVPPDGDPHFPHSGRRCLAHRPKTAKDVQPLGPQPQTKVIL